MMVAITNPLAGIGGNRNGNRTKAMKEARKVADLRAGWKYMISATAKKMRLAHRLPWL